VVTDPEYMIDPAKQPLIQKGKRFFMKIIA